MYNPVATYRIQFNKDFTFSDFENILSYLKKLGVGTIYASPIFQSVPGSAHGYDGVDPTKINTEIGTEEQLLAISRKLKTDEIGWLQDIVPNHMGVHPTNLWLMDVLEKGRQSKYADFFDIGFTSDLFANEPIMMPFLANAPNEAIENGELKIAFKNNKLVFEYFDNYWPLNQQSYVRLLPNNVEDLKTKSLGDVEQILVETNNDKQLIRELAAEQYYRLCSFEETDKTINYRRFFTVNSLLCINIQQPKVFKAYHQFIKKMLDEGVFQGLRIDHVDGLYDPEKYLQNLKSLSGDNTFIIVEKILERGEQLPSTWPIEGTTGYDFLAQINNLLTYGSSKKKLTSYYQGLIKDITPVSQKILKNKSAILSNHMSGELDNLYNYLLKLKLVDETELANIGPETLKQTIGQLLVHCPVYRYYGNQVPLNKLDSVAFENILDSVAGNKQLKPATELLKKTLLRHPLNTNAINERMLQFYQRLMQFSGPLMAKGVEDTLMYTHNQFIGHNEVGDAPDAFGISIKDFHKLMKTRQRQWPLALNATSTHDTKRGEDVRARLNVLAAIPDVWLAVVKQWQKLESDSPIPDANDKYFIYQTITGAYPMPGQSEDNFSERLKEYLIKALREGKQNSDWAKPNETYEKATLDFASNLLDKQSLFWQSFARFQPQIADFGILNSLAQVLLKFTCPGVPDVYQGCELWDLSLVDPDNRRPVDYKLRESLLDNLSADNDPTHFAEFWTNRYNGEIKLWLTKQLFGLRKTENDLFAKGEYIPLKVKGIYKDHVIAFARRHQNQWLIVAVPLYSAVICNQQQTDPLNINWADTRIVIPPEAPEKWISALSINDKFNVEKELLISVIFKDAPFNILKAAIAENNRGSGILMHISSLPSGFGIGDMGPGAKTFANFLSRCGQKYWQILPLNPTGAEQKYSPYSSLCSMSGNSLLISPTLLLKDGFLNEHFLNELHIEQTDKVDFDAVEAIKQQMFEAAYDTFQSGKFDQLKKKYHIFCSHESYWLDDFALYLAIRYNHDDQPWYKWGDDLKCRDDIAIEAFKIQHIKLIDKIKWLQFIFYKQWHQLRHYCKTLNIKLLGDLPFYLSYDSADVWANQHLFALDDKSNMTGIAGVPPDYFNTNGQLWNMPVYNWEALKQDGYKWWLNRLKKNMELFDLIRLDHFRAFASYWEVPAGEATAINGKWIDGPGDNFFEIVKKAFEGFPFVVEDLGDIDSKVFELRDKLGLPGIKVLQFAFGKDMPQSYYAPHNYNTNSIVYTGTHDNNTILGWYENDIDKETIDQLITYTGIAIKRKNINEELIRLAYSSTANLAIIPMQDLLKLDEKARMNKPASEAYNWVWRMMPSLVTSEIEDSLLKKVKMYNPQ